MQVHRVENETEKFSLLKSSPGPKKSHIDQRMPRRPGYGTQGKRIMLWANCFEMVAKGDPLLFRYSIELLPDPPAKQPVGRRVRRIIELLLEENFTASRNSIATDYKSNLICRIELPMDKEVYHVIYRSEDEDQPAPNAKAYRVRLQNTGTLRVSELTDYLASTNAGAMFGSKDEILQALNIVVGHYPKSAPDIFSVGANKHFELTRAGSETMSLGAGLQAIRGFFISVRAATSRILVNVQVKHTACYDEGPLGRLMLAYLDQNNRSMLRLGGFLKRIRINVTHIVRKNRLGQVIPRVKTIEALATPGDGHGLQHPPIVPYMGAGTREVKFFLGRPGEQAGGGEQPSAGKKGKKKGKAGPEQPQTGYISVYDFFQASKSLRYPYLPNSCH
jgi:eukaryotic translation initiation factor 2C